jgi:hypothetical protein
MVISRFIRSILNGATRPSLQAETKGPPGLAPPGTLPAAALKLERQCVLLKRIGTDLAGVWGGDGIVPPPPGPYRHWISVDSRYLPSGSGSNGVFSVYTNEEDCASGIVVFSHAVALEQGTGEYLYAHPARSLPPPDANPDLENAAYTAHWTRNCPLYNDQDVVAVLGGWHFPWPDDDWETLRDCELLVWTIAGAEPWVEVWRSNGQTRVMQRIT